MMSFRVRLLLSILAVVVLTTALSLIIAQRQNRASFQNLADQLFRMQSDTFRERQEIADAAAVEEVRRLATSVRLFAALEEHDPDVYKIAGDELRLGEFGFFRLLDHSGQLLPLGAESPARLPGLEDFENRIPVEALAGREGDVQLGFLMLKQNAGAPEPYRVLAASITSFGLHVGTLVVGQRIEPPVVQISGPDVAPVHSALAIEGQLAGDDGLAPLPTMQQGDAAEDRVDSFVSAAGETWLYRRSLLNVDSLFPAAWLVSALSLATFEAEQRTLAVRITVTGIVASLLAGLVALVMARRLSEPVAQLVKATRAIRGGDFALRLPPSGIREMNTLAESFNDMAAGLELKERYHSVLQQVTDPQVAEGLITGQVKLGGELRDVTVMFCDIRGYTALSVGRNPEDIIELLNHHMSAMTAVVQAHRGVINQFAGDAIMALFGAPRSYGDDAARAVRCALAMLTERERLNAIVHEPIRVGIGLASGEMVAGCIGAENRNDYTVVGERVNLAARLCSTARGGEVLIDENTRARIEADLATEPVPPLTLKGFSQPMPAFRVIR
jgi:class 3 adenylate cyclase